jgi:hypothetical protein
MYDHPFRGKEDYSSFVTLNDDVMPANIEFLIQCYQELGRKDLLRPIRKALELTTRLQQPAPPGPMGRPILREDAQARPCPQL